MQLRPSITTTCRRPVLLGLLLQAAHAHAEPLVLSAEQLDAGIDAYWQERNQRENRNGDHAKRRWQVTEALGCLPAYDERRHQVWRNHWLCVGKTDSEDFHADAMIQVDRHGWRVIDLGGSPACASLQEAQSELRRITGLDALEITGEIDDGQGMFTDTRGSIYSDERHPYRVMCRYESNLSHYTTYLWYADGRYLFDPGDMSGTGVPEPRYIRKITPVDQTMPESR